MAQLSPLSIGRSGRAVDPAPTARRARLPSRPRGCGAIVRRAETVSGQSRSPRRQHFLDKLLGHSQRRDIDIVNKSLPPRHIETASYHPIVLNDELSKGERRVLEVIKVDRALHSRRLFTDLETDQGTAQSGLNIGRSPFVRTEVKDVPYNRITTAKYESKEPGLASMITGSEALPHRLVYQVERLHRNLDRLVATG